MNPIGTVISTEKNPSASGFYFVINGQARKGQFVMLDTEEVRNLKEEYLWNKPALILQTIKSNAYLI